MYYHKTPLSNHWSNNIRKPSHAKGYPCAKVYKLCLSYLYFHRTSRCIFETLPIFVSQTSFLRLYHSSLWISRLSEKWYMTLDIAPFSLNYWTITSRTLCTYHIPALLNMSIWWEYKQYLFLSCTEALLNQVSSTRLFIDAISAVART